jgi:hypothetical protein
MTIHEVVIDDKTMSVFKCPEMAENHAALFNGTDTFRRSDARVVERNIFD